MYFFLIVFGILTFFYSYIGGRIIIPGGLIYPWNLISWIALLVFLILPFLSITLRIYGYHNYFIYLLTWISYLSLGFFTLLFLFLFARDIVLYVILGSAKLISLIRSLAEWGSSEPFNPERHRFLVHSLNMGIVGINSLLTGYGIFSALRGPRIEHVTIPIKNLPDSLEGFRVFQITDVHIGSTIRRSYVEKIVRMTKEIDCDAIVITGDLVDGKVEKLKNDVAPLNELRAQYGKYFVTGNHEYYSGVIPWTKEIEKLGFTVLSNEHRIIRHGNGRILLAGVPDFSGGHSFRNEESSPGAALAGASPHDVKILLAHQPRSIFKAAEAGYDLMISGHTHGGQYFPWNFFVGLQQPYTSGLHRHGETWIYVSSGSGYWGPPLRGGVPSEITVITLGGEL